MYEAYACMYEHCTRKYDGCLLDACTVRVTVLSVCFFPLHNDSLRSSDPFPLFFFVFDFCMGENDKLQKLPPRARVSRKAVCGPETSTMMHRTKYTSDFNAKQARYLCFASVEKLQRYLPTRLSRLFYYTCEHANTGTQPRGLFFGSTYHLLILFIRMESGMRLRNVCPQCNTIVHEKRLVCGCGHAFSSKRRRIVFF